MPDPVEMPAPVRTAIIAMRSVIRPSVCHARLVVLAEHFIEGVRCRGPLDPYFELVKVCALGDPIKHRSRYREAPGSEHGE